MRKRLRSILKWGCTAATVLLLVVWVGSAWWVVTIVSNPNGIISLRFGTFTVVWRDPAVPTTAWSIHGSPPQRPEMQWSFVFDATTTYSGTRFRGIEIPLWTAVATAGAAAGWFWYRDRHRAPGLCIKCGYDLRGADHAVCPECGAAAPRELNRRT
ncbi:MAG: hypothetical protein IT430_14110 [Phycisphaerales bacterium]|nr:hypothetical protein [Phycisphaerales bacterium]